MNNNQKRILGIVMFSISIVLLSATSIFKNSLHISDRNMEFPQINLDAWVWSGLAFLMMFSGIYLLIKSSPIFKRLSGPHPKSANDRLKEK